MKLLEIMQQEACKIPLSGEFNAVNIHEACKDLDEAKYTDLAADKDMEGVVLKFLYSVAKEYGRQKWKEGVEAARNSIVKDESCAPKFVD